jgi:hypothetical protein
MSRTIMKQEAHVLRRQDQSGSVRISLRTLELSLSTIDDERGVVAAAISTIAPEVLITLSQNL